MSSTNEPSVHAQLYVCAACERVTPGPGGPVCQPCALALIETVRSMRAERQAVIDAVNLYGDDTMHRALDAIGWPQASCVCPPPPPGFRSSPTEKCPVHGHLMGDARGR